MKALVVGGGSIGTRHLRNLKNLGINRLALVEPETQQRETLCQEMTLDGFSRLDQALNWDPDFAIIASPTHLHAEQALEIARRGCHLFIEKPLSHTSGKLKDLVEEIECRNLISLVGCNMRFHPGPARVKTLLEQGAIGRVLFARVFGGSYLPDWHPWEDYRHSYSANASMGGGCVLDGIHEIDLARWYVGEVKTVTAMVGQVSDLELDVEDVASIILQHVGGQHSEVHLDYVQRVRVRGCLVVGTDGSIAWDWSDHRVRYFRADQARWFEEPLPTEWSTNQMYVDEMAHFLQCVLSHRNTCNPVTEAAVVTGIALAAKRSSQERRFVDLSEVVI